MMVRIAKKKAKLNQLKKKALMRANSFDDEELRIAVKGEETSSKEKQGNYCSKDNEFTQQQILKVVEENNMFGRVSIAVNSNEEENNQSKE